MSTVPRLRVIQVPKRPLQGSATAFDRTLLALFLLSLMFGPLALGAVEEWSQFTLRAASLILLLLWTANQLLNDRIDIVWTPIFAPACVFGLLILAQSLIPLSAYRAVTVSETLNYCAYGALMFVAVQIVRRDSDARLLAIALVSFGFLLACFAIVQNLSAPGLLYFVRKPLHGGSVYGPYVNRNHYAGLMEMIFPMALVMGLQTGEALSKRTVWIFAAVVMTGSIVLSQSRGGMAASTIEIMAFAVYVARRNRRLALGIVGILVLTASFVVASGGGNALRRFGELGPHDRLTIARDGMHMLTQRPILGWGLETFATVYPSFRSFYTDLVVNEAHNDYLQVLIETGIAGFVTVLVFVALLYRTGLRHLRRWSSSPLAAVRLAALLGCTGILVHSLVDFNLHLPANAALFYSLCGIAAGAGAVEPDRKRNHHSSPKGSHRTDTFYAGEP